jgi:hypothetical protein
MEGCLSSLVKYLLFITNFLVFILGLACFGLGIWVIVDKPSFIGAFEAASNEVTELGELNIDLYSSAAYIILVVAGLIVILSFLGCCGAWKENKCMLGTYFTLLLAMFIIMVVGAVLGYSGTFESTIKDPLLKSIKKYQDNPQDAGKEALKKGWNEVQEELMCCGVNDVADWNSGEWRPENPGWNPSNANKPEGCCKWIVKDGETVIASPTEITTCRTTQGTAESTMYKFKGCYTLMKDTITDYQDTMIGVAIGVVVVMFLNMLFAFAMCTMVE